MKRFQMRRRMPGRGVFRTLFWWEFIRGIILILFRVFFRLQRTGKQHVPATGPVIYAANHQSHLDPCIVGVLVSDRPFAGIARATLFDTKLLAWAMRGIGTVEIERGKPDTAAVKAALEELAAGRSVLIFPEGTRCRDGALAPFKRGVMLLARKSGAPVVPVALEGAHDIWPFGAHFPKFTGKLAVKASAPIPAAELLQDGVDAGLARLNRIIETMRMELRADMRRRTGGAYPAPGPGDVAYWERDRVTR